MMRIPLLLLTLALLASCEAGPEPSAGSVASAQAQAAPDKPMDIKVDDLAARRAAYSVVLDVRTPEEYASGHVPGAILLPIGELESSLDNLQVYKDKEVAVICKSGGRSARATKLLRRNGFEGAQNVLGGTDAWIASGLPVIEGSSPGGKPPAAPKAEPPAVPEPPAAPDPPEEPAPSGSGSP
jgi:rhodanese-related sulfurtransferase